MKNIKLNKETIKKLKEAFNVFVVDEKKGNEMLDKIYGELQHDNTEKFYCEYRDYEVTYRKTCKNCIIASVDEDGYFYCPYYKK